MNQEELIRQEIAKQLAVQNEIPEQEVDIRPYTYPLAGGAIGGGLGFLAANPMDAVLENRKLNRNINANLHKESLEVLDQIHRGKLRWEDIVDPNVRQMLQDMYKVPDNINLLNNKSALDKMLGRPEKVRVFDPKAPIEKVNVHSSGDVAEIIEANKKQRAGGGRLLVLRELAEDGGDRFSGIRNNLKSRRIAQFMPETRPLAAVRKFNHPAVAAGSLVGMLGGSVLATHLAQKNNTEN